MPCQREPSPAPPKPCDIACYLTMVMPLNGGWLSVIGTAFRLRRKGGRRGRAATAGATDYRAARIASPLLTSKPPGASTARCVTLPSCAISA